MTSPRLRWLAPADHRSSLGEVLETLGQSAALLADGAVFVNRRRVTDASASIAGADVVEVFSAVASQTKCRVLERRGDLLIVDKPPELASEPTRQGVESVQRQLSEQLGSEVHIASRLDVGVGGLLLASTSPEGHRHIASLRATGKLRREYLALAGGKPEAATGRWRSAQRKGRRQVVSETCYRTVASTVAAGAASHDLSLLWLEPVTGRTHQLRRHAADAGAPLLGDRRYLGQLRIALPNGGVRELARIMLQAVRVTLTDQNGATWQLAGPLPRELLDLWCSLSSSGPAGSELRAPAALYQALLDGKGPML